MHTDTTRVTAAITQLICTGATEKALLAAVARQFPELTAAAARQH
jgi:hypothetical protein